MVVFWIGAALAGSLGVAALVTAGPASAGSYGVYVGPTYVHSPHRSSCWHWSYRLGGWVNSCRTYSYRAYPRYTYRYAAPYAYSYDYAPSYYYSPYAYSYGPSIGFSFSFGGGHHHHRY